MHDKILNIMCADKVIVRGYCLDIALQTAYLSANRYSQDIQTRIHYQVRSFNNVENHFYAPSEKFNRKQFKYFSI